MTETLTIQEIIDMAKCPIDRTKKLIFVEQVRDELRKRLLTPNTKSKNYIEIPDFEYWLDKVLE